MKKKILFISNVTNRITNFSLPSILASQALGYDFHLASNLSRFTDNPNNYNIEIHHFDISRNPLSLKHFGVYKKLLDLIKQEKFDLVHCNTPTGGVLGRLCGKMANVPKVIYTAHGFHFYKGAPLINRTLFKWAEYWMARYTDAIITMNEEDYIAAQDLKLRKSNNVYFVPGVGINIEYFKNHSEKKNDLRGSLGFDESDVILISVGELSRRKNYESSIKALAKANNVKIKLIICGVGSELNSLQKLAVELGVLSQVHFIGYRTDIKELLHISDVFLFTSYQEGLPRALMEAMATGLPCIASRIRGNIDLIIDKKGGFLKEPDDTDGLALAINTLAFNSELRGEMGSYNLNRIQPYDIENVKKTIKRIYKEVLIDDN